jgi:CDP-diglyceride synthetase
MKNRVLPAIVMIAVLGLAVVGNILIAVPFVALLVILTALLCLVELGECAFAPLGSRAEDAVAAQGAIVIMGTGVVLAGILLVPGDTVYTLPLIGDLTVPNQVTVVLFIMISSIIFENTIAWAIGSVWSKTKRRLNLPPPRSAYPRYSPNKTLVGSLVGVLGAIFLGLLTVEALSANMSQDFHILLIALACLTPPLSECGDWLESRMKRQCNVKNSNSPIVERQSHGLFYHLEKSLGDHGGFLDRTDSLFFCLTCSLLPILVCALWR